MWVTINVYGHFMPGGNRKGGREPIFIPTKGKRARSIDLAAGTVDLLRLHKQAQAAIK